MTEEQDALYGTGGVPRNLTYGLLEALGRAIVVGDFNDTAFPDRGRAGERATPSAVRSRARR